MAGAEAVVCPVCGAPHAPDAPRCAYCGSWVVIRFDHPRIEPGAVNVARVEAQIRRFRAAIREEPQDEAAHYGLGVAYFNRGLLEAAAEELTTAARLVPENPEIQLQLAIVLADLAAQGDVEAEPAAWKRVNLALHLRPGLVEALLLRAELQRRRGEWAGALAAWREEAAADPAAVREPLTRFLTEQADLLADAQRRSRRPAARRPPVDPVKAAAGVGATLAALIAAWVVAALDARGAGLPLAGRLLVAVVAAGAALVLVVQAIGWLWRLRLPAALRRPLVTRRDLAPGTLPPTERLLAAAEDVVHELVRRDAAQREAEAERRLRAAGAIGARARRNRIDIARPGPRIGCAGCLLPMAVFLGLCLVAAALAAR